ncbi:uncharacterized protein [Henckelia pumila]|uniref:uncharacterized protein n=1 Tax=Henckelia pumila TaxID=405737 RepID=UPI003C6DED2F
METLHFENIHHTHDQEEEEETLSLCDLPLYSDEDLSSQESTSFSSSEDDFFEFFSQEYFNPSPPSPAGVPRENIIFCGKLIPYKQPCCDAKSPLIEISRKQEAHITKKDQDYGVISRWDFGSSNSTSERCINSKNDKTRAIPLTPVQKTVKNRHVSNPLRRSPKKVKGCDFPVQKFPVMASSPSGKAKWYLFFFGTSRLSKELDGMNSTRRSRRQCPPPAFRVRSCDDKDRGWPMGGLIGALSCGGHLQADTMVAASIGRPALK